MMYFVESDFKVVLKDKGNLLDLHRVDDCFIVASRNIGIVLSVGLELLYFGLLLFQVGLQPVDQFLPIGQQSRCQLLLFEVEDHFLNVGEQF